VKTGAIVLDAIARIHRELGTLVVIITHNAAIANMANRVIRLSDGQIARIDENLNPQPASSLQW
jgi:putative ABC transport system ATP-binding protein